MQKIDLAYIIDDDEILVMLVQMQMQKNGAFSAVETFCNGEDALTHLKAEIKANASLPAFILLDLNMPIMDGWQFLEEYVQLSLPREIPVFIATSSIDPKDIEKAKKYSVVKGYVMKPIDQPKLNEIIGKLSVIG